MSSPIILSIDGNIGSGKSTLYDDLKSYYKDNDSICFVPEPVEDWKSIVDSDNVPILTNLYKNTNKYAFRFQMMAYISRLNLLRKTIKRKNIKIIITERCVHTDKHVFAQMLYDDGLIEHDEFQIYLKWFEEFLDDIKLTGIIYVKADPDICNTRVQIRNREGEDIPLDYLVKCHNYHEKWLNDYNNKLIIESNVDTSISENSHIRTKWISEIDEWIFKQINIEDSTRERIIYLDDESMTTTSNIPTLYFDGACRGNPSDILGLGAILKDSNNNIIESKFDTNNNGGSNNEAEYLSLILGLQLAIKNEIKVLNVKGDSQLIINQVTGKYQVKAENLIPLYNKVMDLCKSFYTLEFKHIKRELNKEADKLANIALDTLT